ncbi:Nuclear transcription factor Y subunit C [Quillaja saponaria]|uniref:Nuclear transcription factor Y subunit C n=1 Tax=Quillaja saponaria TaxID=32244 RepID=A0AAD7KTH8_QUISA|nr:Nuclear transcription factor Y subunit C [Quillaja saponaria]
MADYENAEPINPEFPTGRVKKITKLDKDVNIVKRHHPTSDFLLRFASYPSHPSDCQSKNINQSRAVADKLVPAGTRRIDNFFHNPESEAPIEIVNES